MSNKISHKGIIDSITSDVAHVRILQSSACSSCKVASHCSSAESKEKIIDVRCDDVSQYAAGQEVTVMISNNAGAKAVIFAFVIPVVVMMVLAFGLIIIANASELVTALSAIGSLVVYYILLYLFRGKLESQLKFWIE